MELKREMKKWKNCVWYEIERNKRKYVLFYLVCFFKGKEREYVVNLLNYSYFKIVIWKKKNKRKLWFHIAFDASIAFDSSIAFDACFDQWTSSLMVRRWLWRETLRCDGGFNVARNLKSTLSHLRFVSSPIRCSLCNMIK